MRTLFLSFVLFLSYICTSFSALTFANSEDAAKLAASEYGKLYVYFCGHCPSARKRMKSDVSKLQQAIDKHMAPLQIICVTPDISGSKLLGYAKSTGVTGAIMAYDKTNNLKISTKNIWQVRLIDPKTGKGKYTPIKNMMSMVTDSSKHAELGNFKYEPIGLKSESLKKVWWASEKGSEKAFKTLIKKAKSAKDSSETGKQLIEFYTALSTKLEAPITKAMEGDDNFITYEALDKSLEDANGILKNKEAETRLRNLKKLSDIKNELKVKGYYLKYMKYLGSTVKNIKKGKEYMAKLAKKYPDTVYGKKAAEI
jgi:hypothetical protein